MRIIISPAKKMREDSDVFTAESLPQFLPQAEELRDYIRALSYAQCRALWNCSDAIAAENVGALCGHGAAHCPDAGPVRLRRHPVPLYGPQRVHRGRACLCPDASAHPLGVLRVPAPLRRVRPYRLEMQAKMADFRCGTLYEYWGAQLADALAGEDGCILNLASRSTAARCGRTWRRLCDGWTACLRKTPGGKLREKATQAKMARGAMVRYLAETGAAAPEDARGFSRFGFSYSGEHSSQDRLVFVKGE